MQVVLISSANSCGDGMVSMEVLGGVLSFWVKVWIFVMVEVRKGSLVFRHVFRGYPDVSEF